MEIINLNAINDETKSPSNSVCQSKGMITDLKSGIRNRNRVNVFIDNEFRFSLDIAQVVDYHLKIGKMVTLTEINELYHASAFGKLYSQTLEWALMRPRSVKETRDHLAQKLAKIEIDNRRRTENRERAKSDPEFKQLARTHRIYTANRETFTKDDIEKVIEQLTAKGYLDDRKFAEWFIENRFINKGVSPLRLRQELLKKGIDANLIDELLNNSSRDEAAEIQKAIQKKGSKLDSQKMLAYLARHGFSFDLSRELVDEYYTNRI